MMMKGFGLSAKHLALRWLDFEELAIFQKARELSQRIYPVTNKDGFKSDFRFVQQIRAAAGSIMDNIAEGFERGGNKEFLNFLYIAKGSCGEPTTNRVQSHACISYAEVRRRKTKVKFAHN